MGYQPTWWEYLYIFAPSVMTGLAVFAGIYFGARVTLKHWPSRKSDDYGSMDSMEIVRERYAKGEVSRSEYERLRDDLSDREASRS